MLKKILDKKGKVDDGFTIIEVLIVLAIAGLILLIVFLAIPALQRNAHNTSRKEDVSSLIAAYNEYVDNNGGSNPAAACGGGTACAFTSNASLGLYKAANVYYALNPAAVPTVGITSGSTEITTGDVIFMTNWTCNTQGTWTSPTNQTLLTQADATSQNVAVVYGIQSPGVVAQVECSSAG